MRKALLSLVWNVRLKFFLQGGVALAADTRATAGSIVADKNCEKLHKLAPNIFCAGAGTAADCDHVTGKKLTSLLRQIINQKCASCRDDQARFGTPQIQHAQ